MNSRNFFTELKQRSAYKFAVAYAFVAWLLIQIATQVFPYFDVPQLVGAPRRFAPGRWFSGCARAGAGV